MLGGLCVVRFACRRSHTSPAIYPRHVETYGPRLTSTETDSHGTDTRTGTETDRQTRQGCTCRPVQRRTYTPRKDTRTDTETDTHGTHTWTDAETDTHGTDTRIDTETDTHARDAHMDRYRVRVRHFTPYAAI